MNVSDEPAISILKVEEDKCRKVLWQIDNHEVRRRQFPKNQ
jgi:hypothetical protein